MRQGDPLTSVRTRDKLLIRLRSTRLPRFHSLCETCATQTSPMRPSVIVDFPPWACGHELSANNITKRAGRCFIPDNITAAADGRDSGVSTPVYGSGFSGLVAAIASLAGRGKFCRSKRSSHGRRARQTRRGGSGPSDPIRGWRRRRRTG